jgi:hypothetical protein
LALVVDAIATFFYLTAIPTAILVLVTCVVWLWYDRGVLPKWRPWLLAVGILARCGNVALFIGMQVYVARYNVAVGLYSQLGSAFCNSLATTAVLDEGGRGA